MRIYIRPDWPPGSNAALLAQQNRGSFGYTWGQRRPPRPVLGAAMPSPHATEMPVSTPPGANAAKLLAVLHRIADQRAALPCTADLAEAIGGGAIVKTYISNLLIQLEDRGLILRRGGTRGGRDVELIERGLVLSTFGPPTPSAEYNAMQTA